MSDDDKFELLAKLIQKLYEVTDTLNAEFSSEGRRFTQDGHLLGSIGEVLAAFAFDLRLDPPSKKGHDARTKDGERVQIKLSAVDSGIALYDRPDFLIAFQLTDKGIETICDGLESGKKTEERSASYKSRQATPFECICHRCHPNRTIPAKNSPQASCEFTPLAGCIS